MGKKTPFYRRGEIQPLPHCTSPHRAVLPLGQGGTTAESGTTAPTQRYYRAGEEDRALAPERYYRERRAVLPLGAVLPLLLLLLVPQNPT